MNMIPLVMANEQGRAHIEKQGLRPYALWCVDT